MAPRKSGGSNAGSSGWARRVHLLTAISRKVVGKRAHDKPERYCGWFLVHWSLKKFDRMARESVDICLRMLKESDKSRFDSYSVRNSELIVSHTILPFGIVACTFFPTTVLEVAIYVFAKCGERTQKGSCAWRICTRIAPQPERKQRTTHKQLIWRVRERTWERGWPVTSKRTYSVDVIFLSAFQINDFKFYYKSL